MPSAVPRSGGSAIRATTIWDGAEALPSRDLGSRGVARILSTALEPSGGGLTSIPRIDRNDTMRIRDRIGMPRRRRIPGERETNSSFWRVGFPPRMAGMINTPLNAASAYAIRANGVRPMTAIFPDRRP